MAEPHGDQPDDTMRGRVPGSRLRLWLLLEADRWVIAGVPLALIFVALVVLGALDPVPLREAITASDPVEAEAAFEDLIEALELFGATREHIKTLYFQWALIDLSRAILYASVPALIVAMGAILFLNDPGTVTGATAGVDNVVWVVSAAATVALAPFMILLSYVLRIATVAKRTLAIGPFILRESTRSDDIEWD